MGAGAQAPAFIGILEPGGDTTAGLVVYLIPLPTAPAYNAEGVEPTFARHPRTPNG
jgi:hypothetical protein